MAKWLGKKTQALSEAVSKTTDKTAFDPDFVDLEKRTDATKNVVEKLTKSMPLYLHPNPAARAKLSIVSGVAKMQKKAAAQRYPHALGEIADICSKSTELGEDSVFGQALVAAGDSFHQITEANHAFDAEVQQNFLDPLKMLMERDIKEIMKHRKKLEGRRLDFDYKRRKQQSGGKVTDAEVKAAEMKVEESKALCESAMSNLLESDVEQVGQLAAFVQAYLNFARTTVDTLEALSGTLQEKMHEAAGRPKREKRVLPKVQYDDDEDYEEEGGSHGSEKPSARAVFDFEAENPGELTFKEGDVITLKRRLDENWLEGEVRGQVGIFPTTYVEIIKDL